MYIFIQDLGVEVGHITVVKNSLYVCWNGIKLVIYNGLYTSWFPHGALGLEKSLNFSYGLQGLEKTFGFRIGSGKTKESVLKS